MSDDPDHLDPWSAHLSRFRIADARVTAIPVEPPNEDLTVLRNLSLIVEEGRYEHLREDASGTPHHQRRITFSDVNVAWLEKRLGEAGIVGPTDREDRARAIFAAVAGAQLMARSRSDIALFDTLVNSYRTAGLLPA